MPKLLKQEGMQQSSATPKNHDVGRGLRKIVVCSQSSSQCLHGVIPTSYFIFNDFNTCTCTMHMEAASTHILSVRVIVVMQLVMWVVPCCSLEQGIHWETRVWTGSRYTWSTYTATKRSKQNWALFIPLSGLHGCTGISPQLEFPPKLGQTICTNEYHHKLLKHFYTILTVPLTRKSPVWNRVCVCYSVSQCQYIFARVSLYLLPLCLPLCNVWTECHWIGGWSMLMR